VRHRSDAFPPVWNQESRRWMNHMWIKFGVTEWRLMIYSCWRKQVSGCNVLFVNCSSAQAHSCSYHFALWGSFLIWNKNSPERRNGENGKTAPACGPGCLTFAPSAKHDGVLLASAPFYYFIYSFVIMNSHRFSFSWSML
jgi:hypothetical protein